MLTWLNPLLFRPRLARFVLLIGDAGAILARISGGAVISHSVLDGAPGDNLARAAGLLAASPAVPLVVLFDVLGQTYRRDRIPVVNFLDRAKIVARKLEVLYPGAEFRGGLRIGAAPGEARSIEYLFAAITPTPELDGWRRLLDTIDNPIDDARLLPVESAALTGRLIAHVAGKAGQVSSWHILVTQHRTGGFRQIIVHKGQLVMTRMTPGALDLGAPEQAGAILQREVGATLDYITRLGFERAEGLDAVFIGRADICEIVRKAQLPVRRLSAFDPAGAEAIAGLSGTQDASGHYADLLHAAWGGGTLLSAMSVLPQEKRKQRLIAVGQSWGARLGFAIAVLGLIYAGALTLELRSLQQELGVAYARQSEMQNRYDAKASILEAGPASIPLMRDMTSIHEQLTAAQPDFSAVFGIVDTAMGDGVQLRSVLAQAEIPAVEFSAATDEQETAAAPEARAINGRLLLVIDLNAVSDVEQAVGEVERLADRLRAAMPDMQTTILRQPLQILPGDTLNITSTGRGLSFPPGHKIAEIEMTGRLQ